MFWLKPSIVIALVCGFGSAVAEELVGEIVSALGNVEILREGTWRPLKPGDQVAAGAVMRTGAGSRAAVQLANGTQLKLNAHSQLELKSITARAQGYIRTSADAVKNVLRVLSGEVWIRNSGEPLEIQTLPATATIRGTEFNLAVGPDDSTSLAVLEGLVELSNPQGSVLVATNERGIAKLGEAPRKTVLVNPRDAVQWTLYYPGQVSYRDYPLTSLLPSQLEKRAEALERHLAGSPQDLKALVELGEISFDLGKREQARKAFEQALGVAPASGRARTGLGWVYLEGGKPEAALDELSRTEPASARTLVGKALALYQLGRLDEAQQVTANAKRRFPSSPLPYTQAALDALIRGEPKLAKQALDQALARDPNDAVARSLQSNIYLVQNHKQLALDKAEQAIRANPSSPTAYLALSAAEQAEFDLDAALKAARKAVELDPENPQTRIQEARLLFGMGRTREAYAVAKEARRLPPKDAMVESTWGFILLARNQIDEATAAFKEAIALDTTNGEPHLGLGLALFRRNRTDAAVAELRKASLLDSQVSLYQSYLGKAYYEVKNDPLVGKSFARAKHLDPRDPTPYFYDAIRLQSINQPVEALENLQESIALNDNRAVYRSRLLLDEDLAARSANLARIYGNLGFDHLAQLEATKSLGFDPANFSAHRFLADSYLDQPRHEIARVSELLQAQLLQPANIDPVQPSLAETELNIASGGSFRSATFSEYSSLFERDRIQVLASAIGGNHSTWGDELIVSGVKGQWSYSLGQFHYETDGFRTNNDQEHDIYHAFAQFTPSPILSLQAEVRRRETRHGDIELRFDSENFSRDDRRTLDQDTWRLGIHVKPHPNHRFIGAFSHTDRTVSLLQVNRTTFAAFGDMLVLDDASTIDGYDAQAQYLFTGRLGNFVLGAGASSFEASRQVTGGFLPLDRPIDSEPVFSISPPPINFTITQGNAYAYVLLSGPYNTDWTFGLSYDSFDDETFDIDELNYKLGLLWDLTQNIRLRAAAFETTKRQLTLDQTLEPTQVAGFNQFFDDLNGTTARRYGIGLDARITQELFAGIEFTARNVEVPTRSASTGSVRWLSHDERSHRAYINWTPARMLALSFEVQYEDISTTERNIFPQKLKTFSLPVGITYHHPSGAFGELVATYADQKMRTFDDSREETQQFVNVDAQIGYRLPKRRGILSLGIRNLFDREFGYQDLNFLRPEPKTDAQFIPERTIFAAVNLSF